MAKPKTTIIYAPEAHIAGIVASDVAAARDRGIPVRMVATEQFRGETEQNAGAVFVERNADDALLFDAIAQAYPHLEVQDLSDADFSTHKAPEVKQAEPELKTLRLQLIGMGGTAPAGADADTLRKLIQEHSLQSDGPARIPVLPTPASQGTPIPDATPVALKADGDMTVSAAAVGSTQPVIDAATDATGEAPVTTKVTEHTPVDQAKVEAPADDKAKPAAKSAPKAGK